MSSGPTCLGNTLTLLVCCATDLDATEATVSQLDIIRVTQHLTVIIDRVTFSIRLLFMLRALLHTNKTLRDIMILYQFVWSLTKPERELFNVSSNMLQVTLETSLFSQSLAMLFY